MIESFLILTKNLTSLLLDGVEIIANGFNEKESC